MNYNLKAWFCMIMAIDRYLAINWAVELWSIKLRKEKSKKLIIRFLVVLSVVVSVPIAWFHRIAEAGNCRLMFQNEPDTIIKNKNMSAVFREISRILIIDPTEVNTVPFIDLSICPKHPVDLHNYYNFFIITWSIGKRFNSKLS